MLELLAILVGIFDIASAIGAAARFWRLTFTLIAFGSVLALICVIWESVAIRWIGGFHLFVIFLVVGLHWESRRGQLRDK